MFRLIGAFSFPYCISVITEEKKKKKSPISERPKTRMSFRRTRCAAVYEPPKKNTPRVRIHLVLLSFRFIRLQNIYLKKKKKLRGMIYALIGRYKYFVVSFFYFFFGIYIHTSGSIPTRINYVKRLLKSLYPRTLWLQTSSTPSKPYTRRR